jgi:hypothetical protein
MIALRRGKHVGFAEINKFVGLLKNIIGLKGSGSLRYARDDRHIARSEATKHRVYRGESQSGNFGMGAIFNCGIYKKRHRKKWVSLM